MRGSTCNVPGYPAQLQPAVSLTASFENNILHQPSFPLPSQHTQLQRGTCLRGTCLFVCNRWLGTPKLVRDTSRRWFWQRGASAGKSSEEVKKDFSDIVLPGQMHDHVRALAAVTSNTKRHGAPFRHMLFYGYASVCLFIRSNAVCADQPCAAVGQPP